ncbi:MAG: metal-dependent transcriptional regulator [Candidatus Micrarchaeota archaeon]|nr:metal-dependent transcriptional regulator [Candidatus Micrarchaeota archaeon]
MAEAIDKYLLAISELLEKNLIVKTSMLAKVLKVKPSSVVDMLLKLEKEDYIIYQKYVGVRLTKKGKEKVKQIKQRTTIFYEFLKKIAVPEKFAYSDAKAIESILSPITLRQMQKFLVFVGLFSPKPCFFDYFEQYLKNGKITKKLAKCSLTIPNQELFKSSKTTTLKKKS